MTNREAPSTLAFVLAFAAVYLIWGSTYLAIKLAVDSIPPFLMLSTRFGAAGLILYSYMRLTGTPRPSVREWKSALLVGGLMLAGGTGTLGWSEQFVPSGLAALLVSTAPLWMVLLDWLWKKNERPKALTLFGIAIGFVGVIVLIDPAGVLSTNEIDYFAATLIVVGAFSWSLGSLKSRDADLPSNPFLAASMQMTSGGLVLGIIGIFMGEVGQFDASTITGQSVMAWTYLCLIGSFIPFIAYIWLMRNTTPARVSTYAFVNPIVAVLLGWAIANEPVTINIIVAIVLLVGAVVLITQQGRRPILRRRPTPPTLACDLDGGQGTIDLIKSNNGRVDSSLKATRGQGQRLPEVGTKDLVNDR